MRPPKRETFFTRVCLLRRGLEVANEDVPIPPKDSTSTLVTISGFRPEDIRSWTNLMNAPIKDLHLLVPESLVLEKRSSPEVMDIRSSPTKYSNHKGKEVEKDVVELRVPQPRPHHPLGLYRELCLPRRAHKNIKRPLHREE